MTYIDYTFLYKNTSYAYTNDVMEGNIIEKQQSALTGGLFIVFSREGESPLKTRRTP